MNNRQLRFYQHDRLASIGVPGGSVRVMNAASTPVCQLGGPPFTETKLLAVDRATSVLASIQSSAINSVAYCAYGNNGTGPLPVAPGFNGEHREAFGVYLLGRGERGYSPSLKRFISADRTSIFLAGNLNAYAYTAGDPINYNDPSGNFRGLIARYKDWKAAKSLVKASKNLKNHIDSTANLKFNVGNEQRKHAQVQRDIQAIDTRLTETNKEMLALMDDMSKMDGTVTYENSKHGIKASYLHAGYAGKASKLRAFESTLDQLNTERLELEKTPSQVKAAEWRLEQNTIAIQAARSRLNYLEKKYPHVASKAIRKIT
ncbi:RHS repeat-associated core domain-containing protein [Pseudomonas putida]|uniref:RHS repeat-associated core domain-containing protein n=1 Tax=Pseudomonas putida TaxID=303 RepID=UPI0030CA6849